MYVYQNGILNFNSRVISKFQKFIFDPHTFKQVGNASRNIQGRRTAALATLIKLFSVGQTSYPNKKATRLQRFILVRIMSIEHQRQNDLHIVIDKYVPQCLIDSCNTILSTVHQRYHHHQNICEMFKTVLTRTSLKRVPLLFVISIDYTTTDQNINQVCTNVFQIQYNSIFLTFNFNFLKILKYSSLHFPCNHVIIQYQKKKSGKGKILKNQVQEIINMFRRIQFINIIAQVKYV